MKKFLTILLFALMMFNFQAQAQTLQAKVNRTDVPQGEVIMLSLEYKGKNTGKEPELSVLNQNFNIFSVAQASQRSYNNGETSESKLWHVGLMPKSAGKTLIPAIRLGNILSQEIEVNVIPLTDYKPEQVEEGEELPRYAIEATVDNKNPYVQQEINLSIIIYDAGGLQGGVPQFSDDGKNDWNIMALGEPELESKVINGNSVRLIKFNYALFPQKSGDLVIPSAQFGGYYLTGGKGANDPIQMLLNNQFGNIGLSFSGLSTANRNPVLLSTKPINVKVKPSINNQKWWLPAEKVELYSEWQPSPPVFKVGEAVSRNIYLKAVGVSDKQLPKLDWGQTENIKQYPEKPIAENKIENGQVASIQKTTNVYIPSQAGKAIIPEIKVDWFNVKTGKTETTKLPAMEIMVNSGNLSSNNLVNNIAAPEKMVEKTTSQPKQTIKGIKPRNNYWLYGGIVLAFALGMLLSYLMFKKNKNQPSPQSEANKQNFGAVIVKSAQQKNLKALRDNLVWWARENYKNPRITNLKEVAKAAEDDEFSEALEKLSQALYAPKAEKWDEEKLLNSFKKLNKFRHPNRAATSPLPKLYK